MKYTIEDIKALANVEKKFIEQDNRKRQNKNDEYKNSIDFDRLFEIDRCFMELNSNGVNYFEFKTSTFCAAFRWNNIFISIKDFGGYCEIATYKKDKFEYIRYNNETTTKMFKWLSDNCDEICKCAEEKIEMLYQNKMNKIVELANKEY